MDLSEKIGKDERFIEKLEKFRIGYRPKDFNKRQFEQLIETNHEKEESHSNERSLKEL